MDINVILVCFNENYLLPHTIKHYKKYLPSCKITIYDNRSTDDSVSIAESLGCKIIDWDTEDRINDFKLRDLKNNCWKTINQGWIIMADMDEFLCVTEEDLCKEMKAGTSILTTKGYDMLGESNKIDISDIDLQDIKKYIDNNFENKNLCFLREKIKDMNYVIGAHKCKPTGDPIFSSTVYMNKHMKNLGLDFVIERMNRAYERSTYMRKLGKCYHYHNDIEKLKKEFNNNLKMAKTLQ